MNCVVCAKCTTIVEIHYNDKLILQQKQLKRQVRVLTTKNTELERELEAAKAEREQALKVLIEKQALDRELIVSKKDQHEMTRNVRVMQKNLTQCREEVDRLNRELGRALKQGGLRHRELSQNEDLISKLKDEVLNRLINFNLFIGCS